MITQKYNNAGAGGRIHAITFDAMGTLIVPYPSVGEIYARELGKLGYTLDSHLLGTNFINAFKQFRQDQPHAVLNRSSWHTIVADTLSGLTPSDDFDLQFNTLWNAFALAEHWRLLSGVEETLEKLRADGLRLFVLSNNDERLHSILEGLHIGRFFEEIFVSAELGAEKPAKRLFELIQKRIREQPEHILHVGDKIIEDVQGALRAGWNAALVGSSAGTGSDLPDIRQAGSISELFTGSPVLAAPKRTTDDF